MELSEHHIASVATSPTQMEFVTSVPSVDVSGACLHVIVKDFFVFTGA